ncbi:hypothetical protein ACWDPV_22725 [Gordonia sp. NPDC003504]
MAAVYERELTYLVDYARTDWLGFSAIVGSAAVLSRRDGTRGQQEFMFDLVGDLLDRGVSAGDLTSSDAVPFRAWAGRTHDVMLRIRQAVDSLGHLPDTGDVCWFAIL